MVEPAARVRQNIRWGLDRFRNRDFVRAHAGRPRSSPMPARPGPRRRPANGAARCGGSRTCGAGDGSVAHADRCRHRLAQAGHLVERGGLHPDKRSMPQIGAAGLLEQNHGPPIAVSVRATGRTTCGIGLTPGRTPATRARATCAEKSRAGDRGATIGKEHGPGGYRAPSPCPSPQARARDDGRHENGALRRRFRIPEPDNGYSTPACFPPAPATAATRPPRCRAKNASSRV